MADAADVLGPGPISRSRAEVWASRIPFTMRSSGLWSGRKAIWTPVPSWTSAPPASRYQRPLRRGVATVVASVGPLTPTRACP